MIILLLALVIFLYLKWIFCMFYIPFASAYARYQANKKSKYWKVLSIPYYILNKIFKGGADRYVLFNIGYIPSHHIRRLIYRVIGAKIQKNVVLHYGLEMRKIYNLEIGQGTIVGDKAILDARIGCT